MFDYNNDLVHLVEVGPRDGLQNEKKVLTIEQKLHYIDLLVKAGLKTIEVASFVRPDKIPQMANANDIFQKVLNLKTNGVEFPCLVPNLNGLERAKNAGVKHIALFSATSDEFTKKNINKTVAESFEIMQDVANEAKKHQMKIRAYISTAYGCPYAGKLPNKALIDVLERFLKLDVDEVSIGDTIGVATPKEVYLSLKEIENFNVLDKVAMHFHDTRGLALANITASLEAGIRKFDASSGGLGGCPYAKGATGNVATEDVIYLMNSLGLKTNIDLERLLLASNYILEQVEKESSSKLVSVLNKRAKD